MNVINYVVHVMDRICDNTFYPYFHCKTYEMVNVEARMCH